MDFKSSREICCFYIDTDGITVYIVLVQQIQ